MAKIKTSSTNFENKNILENGCPEIYAVNLIRGQWILSICYCLIKGGRQRFSELRKGIPNITERMLTLQLKKMEETKLVQKYVFAEVPPRVEYELTEIGKGLIPIIQLLGDWGQVHREHMLE